MDKFRPPTNYSVKTNKGGYKILTEEPDVPTWTTNSGKSSSRGNKRKIFDEDSYFDEDNDPPPPPGSAYDPFNPTGGGNASNDQGKTSYSTRDTFILVESLLFWKERTVIYSKMLPKAFDNSVPYAGAHLLNFIKEQFSFWIFQYFVFLLNCP